jgi:hypothetical protein
MNKELHNQAVKMSLDYKNPKHFIYEGKINLFNDLVDVAIENFHKDAKVGDKVYIYYLTFANKFWDNLTDNEKNSLASVGYEKQDFVDEFTKGVTVVVNPKRGKQYFLMGRQ